MTTPASALDAICICGPGSLPHKADHNDGRSACDCHGTAMCKRMYAAVHSAPSGESSG